MSLQIILTVSVKTVGSFSNDEVNGKKKITWK